MFLKESHEKIRKMKSESRFNFEMNESHLYFRYLLGFNGFFLSFTKNQTLKSSKFVLCHLVKRLNTKFGGFKTVKHLWIKGFDASASDFRH